MSEEQPPNMEYELREITEILPYQKNSKIHSEENIKILMASINESGLINAIKVDKNMVIIGGHGRLEACRRLGMRYIKTEILSHLDEDGVKIARISDNKTASLEYDAVMMLEELGDIKKLDLDPNALGFSEEEYQKLTDDYNSMDLSALTQDLDADINEQQEQGEIDINEADQKTIPIIAALGFKDIPLEQSRNIAIFIGAIQDDYGDTPEGSFVKFISDFVEGI